MHSCALAGAVAAAAGTAGVAHSAAACLQEADISACSSCTCYHTLVQRCCGLVLCSAAEQSTADLCAAQAP
jgi:hypothetical protein